MPEIVVKSDFDGYFEHLVRAWVAKKELAGSEFKNRTIVVSAGPYRAAAVQYFQMTDGLLILDFYSALRNGFGGLSSEDVTGIIELL